MNKIGLQAYSVRDFMTDKKDIDDTFRKLKAMGYDQLQTAGCAIPYADYAQLAKDNGLEIIGTHDNFNLMVEDFEAALENHRILGTTNMGIGGMRFNTCDEVRDFIEKANIIAEKLSKYGMKFTYHNHAHEFVRFENGVSMFEMLTDGLDAENTSFVFDTYWAQFAGLDPIAMLEKLAGRIDIVHLKDMMIDRENVQKITSVGNGNMNWSGIIDACERTGVKYYIVEQDENWEPDCFAAVKMSAAYLKKNFI